MANNVEHAIGLISQGLRLLANATVTTHREVLPKKPAPTHVTLKNTDLFKPSGRLNEQGVDFINSLFEQNMPKADIARRLGITYRAVQLRYDAWQNTKRMELVERANASARRKAAREASRASKAVSDLVAA